MRGSGASRTRGVDDPNLLRGWPTVGTPARTGRWLSSLRRTRPDRRPQTAARSAIRSRGFQIASSMPAPGCASDRRRLASPRRYTRTIAARRPITFGLPTSPAPATPSNASVSIRLRQRARRDRATPPPRIPLHAAWSGATSTTDRQARTLVTSRPCPVILGPDRAGPFNPRLRCLALRDTRVLEWKVRSCYRLRRSLRALHPTASCGPSYAGAFEHARVQRVDMCANPSYIQPIVELRERQISGRGVMAIDPEQTFSALATPTQGDPGAARPGRGDGQELAAPFPPQPASVSKHLKCSNAD
jgi:hypothetical protein